MACTMDDCFGVLDAPFVCVTGADVPMLYLTNLEMATLLQIDDVVMAVNKMLGKELRGGR
jgi:pyruvate/2-oxoglutarate/acetoin dehydrogenase E1 component